MLSAIKHGRVTLPERALPLTAASRHDALRFLNDQPDLRGLLAATADEHVATAGFYRRSERSFETTSLADFGGHAYATARCLRHHGVVEGDIVVISISANDDAMRVFLASIAIGAIPLILAVRPAFDDPTTQHNRLDTVLAGLPSDPVVAIANGATRPPATRPCRIIELPSTLNGYDAAIIDAAPAAADDLAYLQLSSGSTGTPRPIAVTHAAVVANIKSLANRCRLESDDIFNVWLPLYHDLALVAFALVPMAMRASFSFMTPFDFLGNPSSWMRAMSDMKATSTAAPNFGLRHAVSHTRDERLEGIDLSSLRRVCCGAEPIAADTLRGFIDRFAPYGMRDDVLMPTYGMAETTLMLTMPDHRRPIQTLAVPRSSLLELGKPTAVTSGLMHERPELGDDLVEVVGLGPAGDDTEIWICDADGTRIESNLVCGEVVTRSDSLTAGYLRSDGSIDAFDPNGFHTGDIGFLDHGELYLVDRLKNTIIRHGQNISAGSVETLVADIASVAADSVVVIDSDLAEGVGRLTALVELDRKADPGPIIAAIRDSLDRFRPPLEELIVVRPGGLPRTTSGKKQHRRARQLLETGALAIDSRHDFAVPPAESEPAVLDLTAIEVRTAVFDVVTRIAGRRRRDVVVTDRSLLAADLGIDSLAMYEMATTLEELLDIEIEESDLRRVAKVGDLATICTDRRRMPSAPDGTRRGISAAIEAAAEPFPQVLLTAEVQKGRQVEIDGRWMSDFASCNYLGFDLHPDVIDSIDPAVRRWGVHPSWTRAVASPAPYRELEEALASLVGTPDTVVFPTSTLLHIGVLPALATPDGVIFVDRAAHQSLHQATDLARAHGTTVVAFEHDDLAHLERELGNHAAERRILVVDGVYSMSGGPAPLAKLVAIAERYDATVYVDDAHGFGVLGESPDADQPYGYRGNGVVRHLGLDYDRIVYTASLSKAYSSMGAFITVRSPEERRRFEAAPTMIFSGPIPTASLASALAGLEVNNSRGDAIRHRLSSLTRRLIDGVRDLGLPGDNGHGLPIVNVTIGSVEDARRGADVLWDHGLLVTPSVFPAVPLDESGLRFTVTAANTVDEIDQAVAALGAVLANRLVGSTAG